jgi:Ca2+-binding RTX toxin-like protein
MNAGARAAVLLCVTVSLVGMPSGPVAAGENGCTVTRVPDAETLRGSDPDDIICGRGGDDVLIGRGGRDILRGGEGSDALRPGGGGGRVIRGDVRNLVSYADTEIAVAVDLRGGRATGDGRDVLIDVENAVGSFVDDVPFGGPGPNLIRGYRGGDLIRGRGGDDKLVGAGNADRLYGGPEDDVLNGGPGNDLCKQGEGDCRIQSCEL